SAKLGIATGRNLAEIMRDEYPPRVVFGFWILAEVVAMATDLAEFLGAALGFYLLFGIPLFIAGLLTGLVTFMILALERSGFRYLEAVITALLSVIAVSYLIETLIGRPDWAQAAGSFAPPRFAGGESVLLAASILGATVMPHVIFLHSALTQGRIVVHEPALLRRLYHFEVVDVVVAMGIAGLVNAAMLIMAAATFNATGRSDVASIEQAHETLTPLLGQASSTIFAISLLASGLSSSSVGTMSGQVVMQGFLHRVIPVWLRRSVTMLPALIIIAIGLDPTRTLVISQVLLSFGIPFALIPLVLFTRRRDLMGPLVNLPTTTFVAGVVAALIVALNLFLLFQTFTGGGS
ncbi:MAG: Nramp family divalent metal transporter, partial [Chloroflexota bacterium]